VKPFVSIRKKRSRRGIDPLWQSIVTPAQALPQEVTPE